VVRSRRILVPGASMRNRLLERIALGQLATVQRAAATGLAAETMSSAMPTSRRKRSPTAHSCDLRIVADWRPVGRRPAADIACIAPQSRLFGRPARCHRADRMLDFSSRLVQNDVPIGTSHDKCCCSEKSGGPKEAALGR
jgi:hypothetical protein